MNSKILKSLLVAVFSLSLISTANAGLIEGQLYSDADGVQWEYVGYFYLGDGPDASRPEVAVPYNGIQAAITVFGLLSNGEEYALSSNLISDYSNNIEEFIVNHQAWYDIYDGARLGESIQEFSESVTANNYGGAYYDSVGDNDSVGDISAYVYDRALRPDDRIEPEDYITTNYVFKSVSVNVPEPSTLAIFSIALVGLSLRRNRNK